MYREKKRYGQKPSIVIKSSQSTFNQPLRQKQKKLIFVCSWSDFFIEEADPWRAEAWEIIKNTPHIYQILTKRPERIYDCLPDDWHSGAYNNVWLGVSVESNAEVNRIDVLQSPSLGNNLRWVSLEPLLGPIDIRSYLQEANVGDEEHDIWLEPLSWVVVGGESGPNARPMNTEWALDIQKQCADYDTPFFFKQYGGNKQVDGIWGGDKLNRRVYHEFPEF